MDAKVNTTFLFAQPSFLSGVARVVDLYGLLDDYNISESRDEADARAIAADWLVVGQDIHNAMASCSLEQR